MRRVFALFQATIGAFVVFHLTMNPMVEAAENLISNQDQLNYQIDEKTYSLSISQPTVIPFQNINLRSASSMGTDCSNAMSPNGLFEDMIGIGDIVNIGRSLWDLVNQGIPKAHIESDVAHALPRGIKCWTELNHWQGLTYTDMTAQFDNFLGLRTIDYKFRISFVFGGQLGTKGQFITNATVIPLSADVKWGYHLDSISTIPAVFNMGDKEAPLAAMKIEVNWSMKSLFTTKIRTEQFMAYGDGRLVHIQ